MNLKKDYKHYLYRHIRLDKDEVFYIGIGTVKSKSYFSIAEKIIYNRAYTNNSRNKHWKNIVNKVNYKVEILFNSNDYNFIKEKEIEFIKFYGRKDLGEGTLVNMTNGGDGTRGLIFSDSHRKNLSNAQKNMSPEKRMKRVGKKRSPEAIKNISKAHIGLRNPNCHVKVFCITNGIIYDCIHDAAKELKVSPSNIVSICKGKRKQTKGFTFKYNN